MTRSALLIAAVLASGARAEELGLKAPPGFRVTLWADHTLANDIFTMALDDKGRVVVSGPGYVRRLEDTDGDGKADKATDIADTRTGAMGLLFAYDSYHADAFDLYVSADGKILGHNGDHPGDKYPVYHQRLGSFPFSEHGGHALKIGPEGSLYAIAGNDGNVAGLPRAKTSPIGRSEVGGIIRFPFWLDPEVDVIAHGFRNPYDFDFTPLGDIITYDSDTERDALLPWYTPTRVYHVMEGVHHGWRLPGYTRSLGRPGYYPDTIEPLADMGRGSPTGVCCYRHTQFPEKYRGGVFLLDWTFGKVYFLPLIPEGSSYTPAKPEVFIEPTGMNGFAPTAARVAPDGSLFISIGGRGTRGAIYRIEYRVNGDLPAIPKAQADSELEEVLDAPQPQEAWSEANWIPLVSKIDTHAFEGVATSESEPVARRIRAIEILIRRKRDGLFWVVEKLMASPEPLVRARLAWGLGFPNRLSLEHLWTLARDPHPRVRAAALNSLLRQMDSYPGFFTVNEEVIRESLGHDDRRVRLAAIQFVARSVAGSRSLAAFDAWKKHESRFWRDADSRTLVGLVIAYVESGNPQVARQVNLLRLAADAIDTARLPAERVDAVRAFMLAQGDWNLSAPSLELLSAYSLNGSKQQDAPYSRLLMRGIDANLLTAFPSSSERENLEISRVMAMRQIDYPAAPGKVLSQITRDSHPTRDFHYLTVLSRLTSPREDNLTPTVADALLGMEAKLEGRNLRIKQNWDARLGELAGELLTRYPGLDKLLIAHADFVKPGHVTIASQFRGPAREGAARRFLGVLRKDAEFPMSPELVELLADLPPEEYRTAFRARWADRGAREAMVKYLALRPSPEDRERFLDALESGSPGIARTCCEAISFLPRDAAPEHLVPALARLRFALQEPKEKALRRDLLRLINQEAHTGFVILEGKTDAISLAAAYRPVFDWFEGAYPALAKQLTGAAEDEDVVRKLLPLVKWDSGDVGRGRKLYRDRGCQSCHEAASRVGPDLAGVTKRLSHEDLFVALVNPSRDVAPAYRVTNVDLKDGRRISGVVVFESAEGLILQTGAAETKRVATDDIESRTPSPKSLMPDGLLKGLKPEDLADLFAFLAKQ